jgi:hypothetical protein
MFAILYNEVSIIQTANTGIGEGLFQQRKIKEHLVYNIS